MIPALNDNGLLPEGIWDCAITEIEETFCWNPHRFALLKGLRKFLSEEWLDLGIGCPILVDGSFVRSKALPADIDVVIDLTDVVDLNILALVLTLRFRHDQLKKTYNVDVWTRHPSIPNDMGVFFQYIGNKAAAELQLDSKHPKGILRIQP